MKEKRWSGVQYILLSFIGVSAFYTVPFLMSLYYTFTQGITDVRFVWFANFAELLTNPAFQLAAKNTLIFIAVSVPVLLLAAIFISIKLGSAMSPFSRWAMLSPMIIPAASAALGWSIIFGDTGLINSGLNLLGLKGLEFMGESYAMAVFILIFIIKNLGYMTIIFTSAISALPKERREVFLLDSMSDFKYAFKVIVPEIKPIIFFASILSVVNCFQIFREIFIIYGEFPPMNLYILQYFMNNNFYKLNYQRLSTAAFIVVLTISVLVGMYIAFKNKKEGGNVK